ncbi:hypothetical protein B0T16DRAFT_24290 [Cercophora newfieldiana]|uniref:Uncharacterized protein n=1 Tax=Cercophora newfieldiana TaxID=92897 RepID=A0AA40CY78_9PEZI|nr:hypothetical protein B0T16DRAFT_24290 [Cercophora newfieldiana]
MSHIPAPPVTFKSITLSSRLWNHRSGQQLGPLPKRPITARSRAAAATNNRSTTGSLSLAQSRLLRAVFQSPPLLSGRCWIAALQLVAENAKSAKMWRNVSTCSSTFLLSPHLAQRNLNLHLGGNRNSDEPSRKKKIRAKCGLEAPVGRRMDFLGSVPVDATRGGAPRGRMGKVDSRKFGMARLLVPSISMVEEYRKGLQPVIQLLGRLSPRTPDCQPLGWCQQCPSDLGRLGRICRGPRGFAPRRRVAKSQTESDERTRAGSGDTDQRKVKLVAVLEF